MAYLDGDGLSTLWAKIKSALSKKVDTVSGKGLSTNDYTTTEKTKLAGIATGANKTSVDTALSSSSTNPVQNKVVNSAISSLQSAVEDTGWLDATKNVTSYSTPIPVQYRQVGKRVELRGSMVVSDTGTIVTIPEAYAPAYDITFQYVQWGFTYTSGSTTTTRAPYTINYTISTTGTISITVHALIGGQSAVPTYSILLSGMSWFID